MLFFDLILNLLKNPYLLEVRKIMIKKLQISQLLRGKYERNH